MGGKGYMSELNWVEETFEKIIKKSEIVVGRNRENIPYTIIDGRFDDMAKSNFCWWTNGFWGGMMWQLYHATNNALYREIAENNEKILDKNLMEAEGLDHDNGFKWLPTSVANYRLTGNTASKNRALLAANNMAGRFNPAGSFIRAWNDWGETKNTGLAIIDCMMNLPLLYWASKEIGDPRFKQIAMLHADTAEKYFIRPDGSVNHIVEFNPETGEYIKSLGGQGYGEGSSWTRGQAWALYGFVLSYIHTKKEEYLGASLRVANYFIANIPDSGLIPVDFRQPEDCTYEDSTAAAIAACGLLEISKQVKEADRIVYEKAATKLIKALVEESCNWDDQVDNILEKCTAAFHDKNHEFSIIYGDYFFIEAIWKLTDKELFIW